MNEKVMNNVYLELSKQKVEVGKEYDFVMLGTKYLPIGRRIILNWENESVPAGIIQVTRCEFGTWKNVEATRVYFKLEDLLS